MLTCTWSSASVRGYSRHRHAGHRIPDHRHGVDDEIELASTRGATPVRLSTSHLERPAKRQFTVRGRDNIDAYCLLAFERQARALGSQPLAVPKLPQSSRQLHESDRGCDID